MVELTPTLNKNSSKPIYIQLATYIREEIQSGRIKPEDKLPSKRALSNYLGLSLNTIQSAYEQLCAEGYVESRPRSGMFVIPFDKDLIIFCKNKDCNEESEQKHMKPGVKFDFNSGKIDLNQFPYTTWRKLTMQSLYEDSGDLLNIGHPQGEEGLRKQISHYLFSSRGVRCSSSQIIIGAGTQVLIGMLSLILGRDKIYAIENPGFHRTGAALKDSGVQVVSIPLDEDGIIVRLLKKSHADVVYVTPSHQFPNGMIMPVSRRMELLKWAEDTGGYIIEDDYDGEYRYKGQPIPALQGLGSGNNVIYLGTFSKSLIPSIRISYMVLPPSLIKEYDTSCTIYKQTVSRLHQETLVRFMSEGFWQSHLNKMRTLYRKKRNILLSSVKKHFGEKVTVIGENAGLHIVLEVKSEMEENELIQAAVSKRVKVYPLSIYYLDKNESPISRVLLGFGGVHEDDIEKGIQLLKEAWFPLPHE